MEKEKVETYLMTHNKYFEPQHMMSLREALLRADDSKMYALQATSLHDPIMILIVSILAGALGIDRFIIGDTGLGLGKLLTCGGFAIWAIIDLFLIMPRTKEVNYQKAMMILA